MPGHPTRIENLGLSDQGMETLHEHVQVTWPGESDFDAEVKRLLNEALDAPGSPTPD